MGHSAWIVSLQDKTQGMIRNTRLRRPPLGPSATASLPCIHQMRQRPQRGHQPLGLWAEGHQPWREQQAGRSGHLSHCINSTLLTEFTFIHSVQSENLPKPRTSVCLCTVHKELINAWGQGTPHGPRWKAEGRSFQGTWPVLPGCLEGAEGWQIVPSGSQSTTGLAEQSQSEP